MSFLETIDTLLRESWGHMRHRERDIYIYMYMEKEQREPSILKKQNLLGIERAHTCAHHHHYDILRTVCDRAGPI